MYGFAGILLNNTFTQNIVTISENEIPTALYTF